MDFNLVLRLKVLMRFLRTFLQKVGIVLGVRKNFVKYFQGNWDLNIRKTYFSVSTISLHRRAYVRTSRTLFNSISMVEKKPV